MGEAAQAGRRGQRGEGGAARAGPSPQKKHSTTKKITKKQIFKNLNGKTVAFSHENCGRISKLFELDFRLSRCHETQKIWNQIVWGIFRFLGPIDFQKKGWPNSSTGPSKFAKCPLPRAPLGLAQNLNFFENFAALFGPLN